MRDWIARWTHGEPWRTWVAHAAIALLLTPVFGARVAVGYYFLRECEQILYAIVDKKKLTPLDHFMDVAAPAVAVVAAVLLMDAIVSVA
jgi:hypothetical protein